MPIILMIKNKSIFQCTLMLYRHYFMDENHNINKPVKSGAALKLNFDKKVSFGEQLAFGYKNQGAMFESEMPQPIELKGGARPESAKKQTSKKKAPNKKMGYFEGHIQALLDKKKASGGAKAPNKKDKVTAEQKQKPLADFNLDTRPQKYFDPDIDPKSKREYERNQLQRL